VIDGLRFTDSKRNQAAVLARQLRLRLVAEGSDIPRNCSNITVSIHAIATFQALNDYLRPRIQGPAAGVSRISGALAAAFASATGLTPPTSSRTNQSSAGGSAPTLPTAGSDDSATASSLLAASPDADGETSTRRRSLRLSAKGTVQAAGPSSSAPQPAGSAVEDAESNGSQDDAPEDEIDAEVGSPTKAVLLIWCTHVLPLHLGLGRGT
jgi:E3 ubiquitin-protein ligase TRIP12